jgi:hypothetical protein
MSIVPNQNRTVICSIVFVDIVEYSKKPVARQLAMKGWFNDLLSGALQHVADSDRIILDTGDGAAICFPGDPEDALFMTNSLKVAIAEHDYPEFALRVGVNLGPVKLVTDINGRPNILGDGINVAQRVMSFAEPNQILVSRSYYEVVACLSEEYPKLFRYCGMHQDKHVREHEVYEVSVGGAQAEASPGGPAAVEAPAAAAFDQAALKALAARLADDIGPIAPLIVNRAAKRATDASALLRAITDAIPLPARRMAFVDDARATLGLEAPATGERPVPEQPAPMQPSVRAPRFAPEQEWLVRVEAVLAKQIGPIAKIIVKKALKAAETRAAFIAALAAAIENERERAEFSAAVEKLET